MKEDKRKNISLSVYANRLMFRSNVLKLYEEQYFPLANIDMESIISQFNNGDYSVINGDDIQNFLYSSPSPDTILNVILHLQSLIALKSDFMDIVERLKDRLVYNPNDLFYEVDGFKITYQDVFNAIKIAEDILKDGRIYKLLYFLLKYDSLKKQIKERLFVMKTISVPNDTRDKLLETLKIKDDEIGIIKIDDSEKGVSIDVGTKKDMVISDLIGRPFVKDCDVEGYDYGPHGDYYMPPRKVVKTFCGRGETSLHLRMIAKERQRRASLSLELSDEMGYILAEETTTLISRNELIRSGIDPYRVGWKPIKMTIQPIKLGDLRFDRRKLSLSQKIALKENMILGRFKK